LVAFDDFCQAKIYQANVTVWDEFDVAKFYITVQDRRVARVQEIERIAHGCADTDGFFFTNWAFFFENLAQVRPFDVVHDQVLTLVGHDEVIEDARQVGMAQAGQDGGFEPELAGVVFGGEQVFLDGDIHVEAFIVSTVNGAHAPVTEHVNNAIASVE
jgi:hypothetical protein